MAQAEAIDALTFSVFAGAEGPVEDEGEDNGFDASHEGCDSEVDVVVSCLLGWAEQFAIEEMEEELRTDISLLHQSDTERKLTF